MGQTPRSGCGNYLLPTPAKVPVYTPNYRFFASWCLCGDGCAGPNLPSVPLASLTLLWLERSMGRCKPDQALVKLVTISVVHLALSASGQNKYGCETPVGSRGAKVVISGRESPLLWDGSLPQPARLASPCNYPARNLLVSGHGEERCGSLFLRLFPLLRNYRG